MVRPPGDWHGDEVGLVRGEARGSSRHREHTIGGFGFRPPFSPPHGCCVD